MFIPTPDLIPSLFATADDDLLLDDEFSKRSMRLDFWLVHRVNRDGRFHEGSRNDGPYYIGDFVL